MPNIAMPENEKSYSTETISAIPPISANQLLGTTLEEKRGRPHLSDFSIGNAPIHFYSIYHSDTQVTEFFGILNKGLSPKEFGQLLSAIAPFGDTDEAYDAIKDWGRILNIKNQTLETQLLRKQHSKMGPFWGILMKQLDFLREHLMTKNLLNPSSQNEIVPLIHWQVDNSGKRSWLYDYLNTNTFSERIRDDFIRKSSADHILRFKNKDQGINPLVGIYTTAHFEPEISWKWPQHEGFHSTDDFDIPTQLMGMAQVAGQALRHGEELLRGNFIQAAENYIKQSSVNLI